MEASSSRKRCDASKTLHYLPLDVTTEILLNLPVKSLLKFSCVCKSWRTLISSDQFIKNHLQISRNSKSYANHSLILDRRNDKPYYTCALSSILDRTAHVNPKVLYYPPPGQNYRPQIYGNCNGLVLLSHPTLASSETVLYNPVTRKFKSLPDSGTTKKKEFGYYVTYGLCYVELDDDYRVVELNTYLDHNYNFVNVLKIFSVRTDSWSKINDDFEWLDLIHNGLPSGISTGFYFGPGIPVDGVLYWVIPSLDQLFAADVVTYTYRTLASPKYVSSSSYGPKLSGVIEFGGLLGVYHCYNNTQFDIWTMRESWTKVLSVPYCVKSIGNSRPLFGQNDGEILLQDDGEYLMVYNSRKNSFIYPVTPYFFVPFRAPSPVYIESLVDPSFDRV